MSAISTSKSGGVRWRKAVSFANKQLKIFRAILDMAFAAMFGHEASHLEVGPPYCAVSDRSRVEEAGIWTVLLRVSSSDELYKPSSPVAGEITADRCASRRIRLQRAVLSASTLSAGEQEFVRRAAADIISTMLLARVDMPNGRAVFRINDAYLYAPLGIIALAGEMNAGEAGPMLCGGAAENMVEAAQKTYRAAPGQGTMPDEMEHTLPRGVIAAWEKRRAWSPAVFACR